LGHILDELAGQDAVFVTNGQLADAMAQAA
jgi:hypothetical protein